MNPISENVRVARDIAAALATNTIPSVLILRDLARKLTWIASQVEALEIQTKELKRNAKVMAEHTGRSK